MNVEDEHKLEAWRLATVTVILRMRTWAIRYGASPLKVWDMLSERVRLATRRATSVESWSSTIMRSFQISTVDAETGQALLDLAGAVGPDVDEWLNFLGDEHQFTFAAARERFDREKKARKAKTEDSVKDANGLLESVGAAKKPKRSKKKAEETAPAENVPTQGELI